jgi:hypothetical protein
MEKDHYFGIAILLGIIAIALFGGQKNALQLQPQTNTTQTQAQTAAQDQLTAEQQLQAKQFAQTHSPYYGMISIQYVNQNSQASYEYVVIQMSQSATTSAQISGWKLQSLSSGQGTSIQTNGVQLYFQNQVNGDGPIVINPGDTIYLITGTSPIGYSFRLNKCSGYLSQFQTFTPYLSTNCPVPKVEASTSIPHIVGNNACLDYIDSFPTCQEQTTPLPLNWSYECTNFITTKLNYASCVDSHKNDSDFYEKEWRVYLNRGQTLWQSEREDIVLYDNNGKIVSELKY